MNDLQSRIHRRTFLAAWDLRDKVALSNPVMLPLSSRLRYVEP